MAGPVVGPPCRGVVEPEVGAEVHDRMLRGQLGGKCGGLPVGQREEDEVAVGKNVRVRGNEGLGRQRRQVRVYGCDWLTCTRSRAHSS